ncbi:MAG: class I SAM-dependent methyltransferase [Kofleriaceae bacterium]
MTFSDHFSAVSTSYATYRPHYPKALVDALADRAPRGVAWDIGCGSGQLSVQLARRFERVIATDPSQAQLAEAPADPRIEYRCAPAEASGLADASIAVAVAAQAAHWFDWPRFVTEVGRVAQPGALIALVMYGNLQLELDDACLDSYRDAVESYWPPERVHVVNRYRDLMLPWPSLEPPAIEMTASWTRDELLGYIGTWSSSQRLAKQHGTTAFDDLRTRLVELWPANEPRTIRWPLTIRLARR